MPCALGHARPRSPLFKAGKALECRVSNPGLRMALKLLGKKSPEILSRKPKPRGSPMMTPPSPDSYERFVRLLSAHEGRLKAFLRSFLHRWEDVEEAAQETSIVAWKKFPGFVDGTDFGAWLLTIGRFEALKVRRAVFGDRLVFQESVWETVLDEGVEEAERLETERHALEGCLEKLGERQREWLAAVYEPGARIREVAGKNGKSEAAFYKLVQRLRLILLECIEQRQQQEAGL